MPYILIIWYGKVKKHETDFVCGGIAVGGRCSARGMRRRGTIQIEFHCGRRSLRHDRHGGKRSDQNARRPDQRRRHL